METEGFFIYFLPPTSEKQGTHRNFGSGEGPTGFSFVSVGDFGFDQLLIYLCCLRIILGFER